MGLFRAIWNPGVLILMSVLLLPSAAGAQNGADREILILHSYHSTMTWTEDMTRGIREALGEEAGLRLYAEHMNWKYHGTQDNLRMLEEIIRSRYGSADLDLVITTDDAALGFVMDRREELFPEVPVVFAGVSPHNAQVLTRGHSQVTGVLEEADLVDTIRLASAASPGMATIHILFEPTESGRAMGREAREEVHRLNPDISVRMATDMTWEEIRNYVQQVPSDEPLLITTYFTDSAGRGFEHEQMVSMVSENTTAPIFTLYDFAMGHGPVGGSVLSGTLQGRAAGELALRILNGESPEAIPPASTGTHVRLADYLAMQRFGIGEEDIPEGYTLLNRPLSLWDTHQTLVISVSAALILLSGFVLILATLLRKVLVMKKELEAQNQELAGLNEEMVSSEEELKAQFDALNQLYEDLNDSENRSSMILQVTHDAILDLGGAGEPVQFSQRWKEALGLETTDLISIESVFERVHPEDHPRFSALLGAAERLDGGYGAQLRLLHTGGHYKWFLVRGMTARQENGEKARQILAFTDIDPLKRMESRLEYLASHDELTGLPNRRTLDREFGEITAKAGGQGALLVIDIDNFKYINDTMGHAFGDRYIQVAGARICQLAGSTARVYRAGGDEFVVLVPGAGPESADRLGRQMVEGFREPLHLEENSFSATVSVGISLYPQDGNTLEELFSRADIAMYQAKEAGKGRHIFYMESMQQAVSRRAELENHLKKALERKEFQLYLQPERNLEDESIWGFEVLLRWLSPELGMVHPGEFIAIAEDSHQILRIGQWVLEEACRLISQMRREWNRDYHIAVNISALQLMQENFVPMVAMTLEKYGLPSRVLELEITETVLLKALEENSRKIRQLRELGVSVALDDFGTGYSSLSYLHHLPISTLKIDKSFIDTAGNLSDRDSLLASMIRMGHVMDLSIVGEGIETIQQADCLRVLGCDRIQGYYLARPMPERDLRRFLALKIEGSDEQIG